MAHSYQSIHRLHLLNFEGNDSVENKDSKSVVHRDNFRDLHGNENIERNDNKKTKELHCIESTKSIKAKKSKVKLRRKLKSHSDIKETLSLTSNYIKRLFHPKYTTDNSRKYRKQRKCCNKTNQIQVLFSCESKKIGRKCRNLNQDLIDEIYHPKLSYYGGLKNRSCTPKTNTQKQVNMKYFDAPKKEGRNVVKAHDLNKVECLCHCSCSSNNEETTKYKVVNFPNYDETDTELEEINLARKYEVQNFQCQTSGQNPDFQKDKQVGATISHVSFAQRGAGDAFDVTNSVSKENYLKKDNAEHYTTINKDCCQHFKTLLDPINIHENALYLAKITLKYLIIGLVLIIWSPCIVTLYFCWLLTYPLRPRYGVPRNPRCSAPIKIVDKKCSKQSQVKTPGRESMRNCMTNNTMQTCDDNCGNIMSFLLRGLNWAYRSIGITFEALTSQDYSAAKETCGKKVRLMTTNPKKKYTLYYSRNKGWVMKSTKLNKNKINERRFKNVHHRNDRDPIDVRFRNPGCSNRIHSEKYVNDKNHFLSTKYPRHRHKHLYQDISGLPILVKHSNPMSKSYISASKMRPQVRLRYKQSKFPVKKLRLAQRPVKTPEKIYKNRFRHKALTNRTKCMKQHPIITIKNKILQYCNETKTNIKAVIDDVESEVFGNDDNCGELYIQTLRKRPWFCVYKKCPSFYPIFLWICKFYENLCHFWLLLISACIWCPLLAFCYLCYAIFCRCL